MKRFLVGVAALVVLLPVLAQAYEVIDGKIYVVFGARQPVFTLDPSVHYDWSHRQIFQSVYDALLKSLVILPNLPPGSPNVGKPLPTL